MYTESVHRAYDGVMCYVSHSTKHVVPLYLYARIGTVLLVIVRSVIVCVGFVTHPALDREFKEETRAYTMYTRRVRAKR